jgi:hypothetical protein
MSDKDTMTRLHERIDDILANQIKVAEDIAAIKTELKLTPKPQPRPCQFFTEHLEEHKKAKSLWQTPLVSTIFDLAKMAIVSVITYFCVKK